MGLARRAAPTPALTSCVDEQDRQPPRACTSPSNTPSRLLPTRKHGSTFKLHEARIGEAGGRVRSSVKAKAACIQP